MFFFSYCTEDTCPRDRGQCRTTLSGGDSDDYVKISKCYCFYGYGGEACAYRTISVVSRVWKVNQFMLMWKPNMIFTY